MKAGEKGSQYFDNLANTLCREVLLTMLWIPIITCPARLHVNEELA